MKAERYYTTEELRKWQESLPSYKRYRKAIENQDEWQQQHEERILRGPSGPIICTKDFPCEHCRLNLGEESG